MTSRVAPVMAPLLPRIHHYLLVTGIKITKQRLGVASVISVHTKTTFPFHVKSNPIQLNWRPAVQSSPYGECSHDHEMFLISRFVVFLQVQDHPLTGHQRQRRWRKSDDRWRRAHRHDGRPGRAPPHRRDSHELGRGSNQHRNVTHRKNNQFKTGK